MTLKKFSLVLGAAASGKSAHAEHLVRSGPGPWLYIATAEPHDAEMQEKIAIHQARRGDGWHTEHCPLDPHPVLLAPAAGIVLFDSVTLWLSNHLLAGADLGAAEARLLDGIARCPVPVVAVSDEVGGGLVPENALGRRFRNAMGALNQRLAARADTVIHVVAGLPVILKGESP